MRGTDKQQSGMFSYISAERRVPEDHPLRAIRVMVEVALRNMWPQFEAMYAKVGRPSIPPEQLLRALLLQVLYTVRSERMLMEQLDYNLLFRWFVGLNLDDPVWDATVFTKNRERLLRGAVAKSFFAEVLAQARSRDLLSTEHFTVDGTLIEAWASHKSFKRKDGDGGEQPPDDPGNRLRGTHLGMRGGFEVWYEPFSEWMVTGSASLSTIGKSYWTRAAAGRRFFDAIWLGPEFHASGDDTYRQFRFGAHVTSLRVWGYEWSVGAGWGYGDRA